MTVVVEIQGEEILDWASFHEVFRNAFGFPDFYGRNMDAWIDCMRSLADPANGLSRVHAPAGGVVAIVLRGCAELATRQPDIYAELIECSALVNLERLEAGKEPVLVLAFSK